MSRIDVASVCLPAAFPAFGIAIAANDAISVNPEQIRFAAHKPFSLHKWLYRSCLNRLPSCHGLLPLAYDFWRMAGWDHAAAFPLALALFGFFHSLNVR